MIDTMMLRQSDHADAYEICPIQAGMLLHHHNFHPEAYSIT